MSTSIDRDDSKRLMVFAGRSSKELGQRIANRLGIELGDVTTLTDSTVMDLIKGNLASTSNED